MGLRGPKPKGAAHAIARGYYRPSRHGPRPEPVKNPEQEWLDAAWELLKLPIGTAPPHPLDPIEELLQREGIEVRPEDRKPAKK